MNGSLVRNISRPGSSFEENITEQEEKKHTPCRTLLSSSIITYILAVAKGVERVVSDQSVNFIQTGEIIKTNERKYYNKEKC